MFDAAFASIAAGFADRFGAPFVDAVAWWPGTPVKDAGGSIISPGTPVDIFDEGRKASKMTPQQFIIQTDPASERDR